MGVGLAVPALDTPLATITAMDRAGQSKWRDSGWDLVIDPFTAQVAAVAAVQNAYRSYAETGSTELDLKALFALYGELGNMAGLDELYAIEDVTTEA